jgi:hypothetical protein
MLLVHFFFLLPLCDDQQNSINPSPLYPTYHQASLGLLEPTTVSSSSAGAQSSIQASVYSDASRVGAAAAAVFKADDASLDQSGSTNGNNEPSLDSLREVETQLEHEDSVQQHEKNEISSVPFPSDKVSLADLKNVLRVGQFNGWNVKEAEALIRLSSHIEDDTVLTPGSVERSSLKEYVQTFNRCYFTNVYVA